MKSNSHKSAVSSEEKNNLLLIEVHYCAICLLRITFQAQRQRSEPLRF